MGIFSVECPTCGRKVKKTDLLLVETKARTRVKCCENCKKYFEVVKVIK